MLDFGFYNMDCMEGMKEFPGKYFELAVVDPPYGVDAGNMTMGSGRHNFSRKSWDKNIPEQRYFHELFRVSKNQIIWGGTTSQNIYLPRSIGSYGINAIRTSHSRRLKSLGYMMGN